MANILDTIRDLLAGEPARAIGYGGAAIVYLVAKASGTIPDVTPEEALVQATAAIALAATFTETIRHFVYSPETVKAIIEATNAVVVPADAVIVETPGDTT